MRAKREMFHFRQNLTCPFFLRHYNPIHTMNRILFVACAVLGLGVSPALPQENKPPVRLAIIGLVHTHVWGPLPRALTNAEIQVVGIVESNQELVAQAAQRYNIEHQSILRKPQ